MTRLRFMPSATYLGVDGYAFGRGTGRAIRAVLLAAALLAAQPPSMAAQNVQIAVNPNVLRPVNGKLQSNLNISVYAQNCTKDTDFSLQTADNKNRFSLWATGGLTPIGSRFGTCSVTSTLTIDPSLPAGTYNIILLKDDQPVGQAALTVMDAAAGAIPPGLAPQVDVIWTVLSRKIVSDVFGTRVAKRFYCIEVKIGNNSGHALQIAGIGFHYKVRDTDVKQANTSYASTRAVLQREEVLSKRNIAYHLLEGAGFLMASFTPYFSEPNPKAHFATASSIVSGALLQVFAVVSPDRVPGQLNNLDDESLRDGSVIANNTQVRTTIFVEKRNLTEALQEAAKEFDGEQKSATGIASFRSTINASASEGSFIHAKSESPFLVRKALGDLILVGDPIDYLPRVQIQSNASQPSSTVSLSPASLNFTKGTKDQKVTLTNTGSGPLTINSVKVGGDTEHFSVTSNPCGSTLAAGANCVITVSFNAPSTVGLLNATLNIDDSASGSPHIVNLSGTEPSVALSTTSLSLPNQTVKTVSSSQKVTLTNTGTGPLTISGITFDGANENIFSLDKTPADACNTTTAVPVQGSCGIYVLVTPSAKGSFSATLSVADDAGDSPQKVSLSGTSQ